MPNKQDGFLSQPIKMDVAESFVKQKVLGRTSSVENK